MPSGPSKEQLEIYWTSSRQYFDELAKYYQTADPAYYKEYILPFYSNPFQSSPGNRSSGSAGVKIVIAMVLFAVIGIAGAAVFIFMSSNDTDEPKTKEKRIESTDTRSNDTKENDTRNNDTKSNDNTIKEPSEIDPSDNGDGLSAEDNFIIGSKAISEKDYDKAEKHLKRIKPGQKYYKEAQQLLENMDLLRKYDK